jgi:hypothetical protein
LITIPSHSHSHSHIGKEEERRGEERRGEEDAIKSKFW